MVVNGDLIITLLPLLLSLHCQSTVPYILLLSTMLGMVYNIFYFYIPIEGFSFVH